MGTHSLKRKILLVFGLSVLPVLVLMFLISLYSIHSNIRNAYEGNLNYVDSNRNLADTQLNEVANLLRQESSDQDMFVRLSSVNQNIRMLAYSEFGRELSRQLNFHPLMDGAMLLSTDAGDSFYKFSENDDNYRDRQKLLQYISQHREELYYANGAWTSVKIGERWALLSSVGDSDVLLVGWVWYSSLYELLDVKSESENETTLILSETNEIRAGDAPEDLDLHKVSGKEEDQIWPLINQRYMVISVPSEAADLKLAAVMNRKRVIGAFYILRFITSGIAVLYAIILAPWLLHVLKKCVFLPVQHMEVAMKEAENGNLGVEIANGHSSAEMDRLICSFNRMIAQIRTLKIQSYEDALRKQELQMNYLQLQIEPHFYLNALNLINTMAQVGDTDLINELTRNLSQYLRYIVSTRSGKTTVGEEISHIENYIQIIRIRMGDTFRFECHVDESLNDMAIPPLMIQMLVENSMKYAFDMYGENFLSLDISDVEGKAVFTYHDSGPGYSSEMLDNFRCGKHPGNNHIGLWNIQQRLNYMYPDCSTFEIFNDHGAWARIVIDRTNAENEACGAKRQ